MDESISEELIDGSEANTGRDIAQAQDEASRLKNLATGVRDQDDLERDIGRQV